LFRGKGFRIFVCGLFVWVCVWFRGCLCLLRFGLFVRVCVWFWGCLCLGCQVLIAGLGLGLICGLGIGFVHGFIQGCVSWVLD
jgi:hypothetical protein